MDIEKLDTIEKEFTQVIAEKKESARSALAITVVVAYTIILLVGIATAVYIDKNMDSVIQVIATLSGIFTGPMVMVITYYFKERKN